MSKILKSENISVYYEDAEGSPKNLHINVCIVDELPKGAHGQYVPEGLKVLIKHASHVTMAHEALHATIDLFRTFDLSFDELFDNKSVFGEEGFCHYFANIFGAIENAVWRMINNGD